MWKPTIWCTVPRLSGATSRDAPAMLAVGQIQNAQAYLVKLLAYDMDSPDDYLQVNSTMLAGNSTRTENAVHPSPSAADTRVDSARYRDGISDTAI